MTWLDKLEKRLGFLAIPRLIRVIVGFNALVFVLAQISSPNGQRVADSAFVRALELDRGAVMHGQLWRLFTYIFIPQTFSPLWVIFALWFLYYVGEGLEQAWGSFRVTLYYLVGMIGTTVAAFFFGGNFANGVLNASLFFAFAWFYPDEVIYVFFVLPVRIKWLAWASAAFLLFGFVVGTPPYRVALVVAFANYLLFFGPEIVRQARDRRAVSSRRKRFEIQSRDAETEPLHRCAVCGATELTDPTLEFRVAADGEEYCLPHLVQTKVARS